MRNHARLFDVLCSCVLVAAQQLVWADDDDFASALQSLNSQVLPNDLRDAVSPPGA